MQPPARVVSIAALAEFRAALATFRADTQDALSANELEIRRNLDWLTEQRRMWQKVIREAQDEVTHCKAELFRRQAVLPGERVPDCTQQIKALRQAQRKLEHGEERLQACRRWEPMVQRAVDEYQGPARQLAAMTDGDLPKAAELLDRLVGSLEAYVAIAGGGPAPQPQQSPPPNPEPEAQP